MLKQIQTNDFADMTKEGVVVVDFFATWCGPCKMIAPYLEDMAKKLEGKVRFLKVDVDEENELAAQQGITAMPTLKIFNNGAVVDTIVGADLQKLRKGIQAELAKLETSEASDTESNDNIAQAA